MSDTSTMYNRVIDQDEPPVGRDKTTYHDSGRAVLDLVGLSISHQKPVTEPVLPEELAHAMARKETEEYLASMSNDPTPDDGQRGPKTSVLGPWVVLGHKKKKKRKHFK